MMPKTFGLMVAFGLLGFGAAYGVFDLATFAPSDTTDVDPAEFDRLWSS